MEGAKLEAACPGLTTEAHSVVQASVKTSSSVLCMSRIKSYHSNANKCSDDND